MTPEEHWRRVMNRTDWTEDVSEILLAPHEFRERLKAFVLRLGIPRRDAEDVEAAAEAELWRSASRFDPARGKFATFICTIAAHCACKWFRRYKREPPMATIVEEALVAADDSARGEAAVRHDVRQYLHDAIGRLPTRIREVVTLRLEGVGNKEIAERLGIQVAAVYAYFGRAIEKLRTDFEQAGFEVPAATRKQTARTRRGDAADERTTEEASI